MGNYVDILQKIYWRVHFDDDADMKGLAEEIKNNEFDPENTVLDFKGFRESEYLHDTSKYISPEDSEDECTIEVFEDEKLIWNNEI